MPSTGCADLETVLFDLGHSYGVGGAAYPKYEPIYLFKDGKSGLCADLASVYWDSKDDLIGGVPDAIWIGGRGYTLED